MAVIPTALLAVTLAFAGGDTPREQGGKKVVGPPLRMGSFAALRGGATSAGGFEVDAQVARKGRVGLDIGLATSTFQRVSNFQPNRQFMTAAILVDGVFAATPGINIGPALSLAYRPYRQEWDLVGHSVIPTAGARVTTGLLTARTWQMHLTVKGSVDLIGTRMVFDTFEIQVLNPVELQIGVRFLLARARSPFVTKDEE